MIRPPASSRPRPRPALATAAALMLLAGLAAAQDGVPDNTGLVLDPSDEGSDAFLEAIEADDAAAEQEALETGGTHVPTLLGPVVAPPPPEPPPPEPTPAAGYDDIAAPAATSYEPYVPPPASAAPRDRGRSDLLRELIDGWSRPPDISRVVWTRAPPAEAAASAAAAPPAAAVPPPFLAAIAAGTGFYARSAYAVNTDYPGPVIVELLEAPLAGATMTGAFEPVRDRLVLRFDRLHHNGRSWPVDAYGVGLDCACFGVAGEYDRHWFARVLLPAAAAFGEGVLRVLGQPQTTLRVADDTILTRTESGLREGIAAGAGQALGAAARVLSEDAPQRATVRLPRGSELVVMFAAAPGADDG